MDWFTGPTAFVGIAVVVVIGGLIALGVRYLESRSRRDEDAARLQQALSEPLAHDPTLAGCSVLPVVSLPLRGSARVELSGWVPSPSLRAAAVRAVEHEAARLGQPIRMIDRLEVTDGGGAMRRPA
jgi:hypothetical protein